MNIHEKEMCSSRRVVFIRDPLEKRERQYLVSCTAAADVVTEMLWNHIDRWNRVDRRFSPGFLQNGGSFDWMES
jgi:hypothetical protein